MGLDIAETSVFVFDPANLDMIGYPNPVSYRFMLFTEEEDAYWIADRFLKEAAFPFATVVLRTNRELFGLQPGDLFKFAYSPWGVSSMICRVISIQEEELGSEEIIVTAREDIDYLSGTVVTTQFSKPSNLQVKSISHNMGVLLNAKIIETPYFFVGLAVGAIPMVAHVTNKEIGYYLYESMDDGINYTQIAEIGVFNPYGVLTDSYKNTPAIDDMAGIFIEFQTTDYRGISNITRPELFSTKNLAVLGDEIITFQYITLVSGTKYKLTGIQRAVMGTFIPKDHHPAGEPFYFIGDNYRTLISFLDSPVGATRKYKFVPFTSSEVGDIDDIDNPLSFIYTGTALCPYPPSNLKAGGKVTPYATYTGDIVLTWDASIRGVGAGTGDPNSVTDDSPTWEGYFRVLIYSNSLITGDRREILGSFTGEDGEAPDPFFWYESDPGSRIEIQSNKLHFDFTGTSNMNGYIYSKQTDLKWFVDGDYDITIDFNATTIDATDEATDYNAVILRLMGKDIDGSTHSVEVKRARNTGHNGYAKGGTHDYIAYVDIPDSSGKLRLVRTGTTVRGFYWSGSQWEWDGDTDGFAFITEQTGPVYPYITFYHPETVLPTTVDFDVDNFTVNAGFVGTRALVRTVSDIDALTWTYTTTMNTADNGDYPNFITAFLTNYLVDENTLLEYESPSVQILVRKE